MNCEPNRDNGISLGIGSTANCNLNCGHCYSRPLRGNTLTYSEFEDIIEGKNKKIHSINFGTGENILNPEFLDMVDLCCKKGIRMSVTSNGYTIGQMDEAILKRFNDVDISLDFPDEIEQNTFRKGASWNFVDEAIKKCQKLRIEFSITTALMNINFKQIPGLLQRAAKENCNLRVNIFKTVPKAGIFEFKLSYDQFWEAVGLLFTHGNLISCSEPIINAMLNIIPAVSQSPCGLESLRIHPDGEVMPCVYWINSNETITLGDGRAIPAEYWTKSTVHIEDLKESFAPAYENESFKRIRTIPEFCRKQCDKVDVCGGGCAGRRYLNGLLDEPDEYCPIYRKLDIPKIEVIKSQDQKDLIHSSYLCTLIFQGRK
ncbi:MAG: radical SAM protein [Candidatus Riflebacteria bacterium]|nr:radical SAM protein [Candidatus Riflebacteria bacterium]